MNLNDAQVLAVSLMAEHGLDGWTFTYDRGRRRAGACHYAKQQITLSRALTEIYDATTIRDIILHEIAHALVGREHHHDAVWKAMARRLGANPRAQLAGNLPQLDAPWVGTCPRCGATKRLFRQPQRVVACGKCSRTFNPDVIFEWAFKGVPRSPAGTYAKELARLRH